MTIVRDPLTTCKGKCCAFYRRRCHNSIVHIANIAQFVCRPLRKRILNWRQSIIRQLRRRGEMASAARYNVTQISWCIQTFVWIIEGTRYCNSRHGTGPISVYFLDCIMWKRFLLLHPTSTHSLFHFGSFIASSNSAHSFYIHKTLYPTEKWTSCVAPTWRGATTSHERAP